MIHEKPGLFLIHFHGGQLQLIRLKEPGIKTVKDLQYGTYSRKYRVKRLKAQMAIQQSAIMSAIKKISP